MKIRMRQIPNQVTAKAAEDRFISKKIAENCAARTIEYYRIRIGQFLDYYGPDELVSEITEDTFDGYIYHLRTTTSANDITINSYLRAVRAFLYYLMKQGYIRSFTCHLPKAEKKLKETYTDTELKLLLKKPDVSTCTFREFRTWAMISYILLSVTEGMPWTELEMMEEIPCSRGTFYDRYRKFFWILDQRRE